MRVDFNFMNDGQPYCAIMVYIFKFLAIIKLCSSFDYTFIDILY